MPEITELDEALAVLAALAAAGCRCWVGGGWGVDALVGRQTRPHRDLDLAVDAAQLGTVLAVLTGATGSREATGPGRPAGLGYVVETDWLPSRVEVHRPGHGWVDLHPVRFDATGTAVQSGRGDEVFLYPPSAFTHGTIGGERVGCMSVGQQRYFRQGYELRPVDHHDLTLLDALG